MPKLRFTLLFFYLLLGSCKQPQSAKPDLLSSIPDPKTLGESYVSDPDKLLSEETVASLNTQLRKLDEAGLVHIDVVFVKSIGTNVPKEVAHALFRKWKIGDKEKNNGLLIFMVKDQRRIEFETGYGMEGPLPDVVCYRIQQEHMVPYAKAGNYDLAVQNGVTAIIDQLKENVGVPVASASPRDSLIDSVSLPANITIESHPVEDNNTEVHFVDKDQDTPRTFGGWMSLIILVIYFFVVIKIARDMSPEGRTPILTPQFWLLLTIPVGCVLLLDAYLPVSWLEIRQLVILYAVLSVLLQLYYCILSKRFLNTLQDLNAHEQYLRWFNTHAKMEWTGKVFPLPLFWKYWKAYRVRLKTLRNTPSTCTACNKPMTRLTEALDDARLSKGQLTEEQVGSVDYDVWQCADCGANTIYDYRNIDSKASECPQCHFKTLMFKTRMIVQHATTSSAGSGYVLSVCKNCGHENKEAFTIARIATSSSGSSSSGSSSSSSSSSSFSTSSGGSSGGGGAGSNW